MTSLTVKALVTGLLAVGFADASSADASSFDWFWTRRRRMSTTPAPSPSPTTTTPPPTTATPAPTTTTPTPVPPGAIQPNTIQFRAHPGRCVETADAGAWQGSLIHLAECDEQAIKQSWLFDTNNSVIRSAMDSSKCLDIINQDVEAGTFLQIWDCYFAEGFTAQQWGYDEEPGRIFHCKDGDCDGTVFCADVAEDVIGTQVEIWNCDDKPVQSWSLGPSSFPPVPLPSPPPPPPPPPPPVAIYPNTIQFRAHSDRCVEMVDADASIGSSVHLAECRDNAINQSWLFDTDNSVIRTAVDSSKCLDITGADLESGTLLQIWDCYFGDAQLWWYDTGPGRIYNCMGSDCFCADVAEDVIGTQIEIWNCDGKPVQSWSLGNSSIPPVLVPATASVSSALLAPAMMESLAGYAVIV